MLFLVVAIHIVVAMTSIQKMHLKFLKRAKASTSILQKARDYLIMVWRSVL